MCILGGDWRFPDEGKQAPRRTGTGGGRPPSGSDAAAEGNVVKLSEPVKEVIRACLRVEPKERPDVDQLVGMIEEAIGELPREDGDVDEEEE